QFDYVRMTIESIVIEVHLGVETDEIPGAGDHEWVDLEQTHVLVEERPIQPLDELHALLDLCVLKLQRIGDVAPDVRAETRSRVDGDGEDLLRRLTCDFLDVHPSFGRRDEGHARGGAIDKTGKVELARDVAAFLDIQTADDPALGACLMRHQVHAEHAFGLGTDVVDRLHDLDAAALAAAAGMDLGLDHPDRSAKRLCCCDRFIDRERRLSSRHRHAVAAKDFLRLMFVYVHEVVPDWLELEASAPTWRCRGVIASPVVAASSRGPAGRD